MGNQQLGGFGGARRGPPTMDDEERMVQTIMATMQMQDYLTMYNSTVEKCFKKCVFNFRTTQLVEKEEVCLNRCVEKMAHYNLRFQQRVGEESIATRERQQKEAEEKARKEQNSPSDASGSSSTTK